MLRDQCLEGFLRLRVQPVQRLVQQPDRTITIEQTSERGAFALAQAEYLRPDAARARAMASVLSAKRVGVVAHYYMDPEVQGVLSAARDEWPFVHISDSLLMADQAVVMVEEGGCESIAVLGVDFMAENVRAVLDRAGHTSVPVYRMDPGDIGCSLADAARGPEYDEYLGAAAAQGRSVHVVYINTSLATKAAANATVPTITCTSSNVVRTVLQAFAQVEGVHVWYGPDSYMGANLVELLESLLELPEEEVARVHPAHTHASVRDALSRLHYFEDGMCVVHDMFGEDVVRTLEEHYVGERDTFLTAHFEVPGGLFGLALKERAAGDSVVGSTAEILAFIKAKTADAVEANEDRALRFVLGTEVGMVTSIVLAVQDMLDGARERLGGDAADVSVEIVFPVSSDAVQGVDAAGAITKSKAGGSSPSLLGLEVVPGAAGGEGCSAEGGCASCPYMKMNSLDALERVVGAIGTDAEAMLEAHKPRVMFEDASEMDRGVEPIIYMREFTKTQRFPDDLAERIEGSVGAVAANAT